MKFSDFFNSLELFSILYLEYLLFDISFWPLASSQSFCQKLMANG